MVKTLGNRANPLVATGDARRPSIQRDSRRRIYDSVMRAGGEPFGAPFEVGTLSLTERIVRLLKQRGFFGFETSERLRRRRVNKFTRYGASRLRGRT